MNLDIPEPVIRELDETDDLRTSARIIRRAFREEPEKFGFNRETWPFASPFITVGRLREAKRDGEAFFGLFRDGKQTGFIAVAQREDRRYWLRRLAVLPSYRHTGDGKRLLERCFEFVRAQGGGTVGFGMIYENTRLRNWYLELGFRELEPKKIDSLPVAIGFFEMDIPPVR